MALFSSPNCYTQSFQQSPNNGLLLGGGETTESIVIVNRKLYWIGAQMAYSSMLNPQKPSSVGLS